MASVSKHLNDLSLLEDRILLMPRSKVEDLAFSNFPDHSTSKPLTQFPGLLKDDFIGFGYMKWFVVHFGLLDFELRW